MRIVCLVKQVPRPDSISFDDETKTLRREGVPLVTNPFDLWAVQHAAALDGEVIAVSMGPPQADESLREAIAHGADRGVLLSDRAFAGADTIGTSRALADAIERLDADLVVCGRKTVDSETSQVPPEVAAMLGRPFVAGAARLEPGLLVTRTNDEGEETWEVDTPAVVSVSQPGPTAEPGAGDVETWSAADLGRDPRFYGQTGSPTRVLAVRDVTPERAGLTAASGAEAVGLVRSLLAERPAPVPSWEKPPHVAEQPKARYDAWTMIETIDGRPTRASLELLARTRELSGKLGGRAVALVFGTTPLALGRHGAEVVHRVDDPRLDDYHPELWAGALRATLERHQPHVLLVPASLRGREYAPYAAGALGLGMTGDCVGVDIAKAGRLLQTKPAYGGNIVSVIMGATTPQLATVRPRMYEPLPERDVDAEERSERPDLPEPRLRLREHTSGGDGWLLDAADVVVSIDPGAGDLDDLARIARDAGAAADTTAAVGLLGRPVAPRLYVSVGRDASFEHLTASVKAAVTVAIGGTGMEGAVDVFVGADPRGALAELLAAAG